VKLCETFHEPSDVSLVDHPKQAPNKDGHGGGAMEALGNTETTWPPFAVGESIGR
jgi:hypothetical protein